MRNQREKFIVFQLLNEMYLSQNSIMSSNHIDHILSSFIENHFKMNIKKFIPQNYSPLFHLYILISCIYNCFL